MARALSLDLDDTLWPIWPAIERAETDLHAHLVAHHPEAAARWTIEAMRELREHMFVAHPEIRHDFSTLRRMSLRHVLGPHGAGDDAIEAAFEVFYAARNRVDLYADAAAALPLLARRYPIASLTNGNADLARVGIRAHFVAEVSARGAGCAKPDPRIFAAAATALGIPAAEIAHVGDDPELDVLGAQRAGMIGVWLNRESRDWPHAEQPDITITRLDELEAALDAYAAGARTARDHAA
jgi:putative hydrolase of the HAD superfamily